MKAKIAVADLHRRGSAPLHRTFPMWAREPKGEGVIEWRMYRGHQQGGALVVAFHSEPGMSRTDVAKGLRTFRNVLFGRDKIKATEVATEAAGPLPHSQHAMETKPADPPPPEARPSAEAQGSLF